MTTWSQFTEEATRISTIFLRRHKATGNLCMLGTLRSDGFPRISPVEPMIFEDQLVIAGMPNTTKFKDLARDPRFCLHTATVDTNVSDGDAKLFGRVVDITDRAVHERFAQKLFDDSGFDIRGQEFDHFFVADLTSASSVEVGDDTLEITIWKPGEGERVVNR
ncbi:pyridoxamine 5'-phosphate oxidase family protein [Nocardia cyriacigeorgica]|uniref:Pyridoxamine 5'-phosphate oxidase family protein n=1 Tax=Nocardia cyriacigeorgica TaxID=135487 RepID=A0ABX0CJG0_9NOCA|nr:pyridoxamine 5'-phosphate oxidase family protein [Nocardia cyriacigeorgica]NEW41623.1 pyridoxamine 5'-phosphate oxidase family protein [Nocardia cyriacigeorgica]NEW52303.1 pyridoxamine 5'-phosphate oxidase family protein [Nocardia cyriacigeorgica]NEW56289.1 pyridoxamine 5'-phosphate oxidase family protein [Nocardia cyriacigeorgica]